MERHSVRVTFGNGNSLVSTINGKPDEIRAYYMNNEFNLGGLRYVDGKETEIDDMQRGVSVEFLN